jgi:hypothetical protein
LPSVHQLELDNRLSAYFGMLRSSFLGDALRRTARNWQTYAAVTGSAMAMATNASAQVIYSGPHRDVTAGPLAVSSYVIGNSARNQGLRATAKVGLKTAGGNPLGVSFRIGVDQFPSDLWVAYAGLNGDGKIGFLTHTTQHNGTTYHHVRKLPFGASIAKASPFNRSSGNLATERFSLAARGAPGSTTALFAGSKVLGKGGWWASRIGFAGFSFSTAPGGIKDYGWIRLGYFVGPDGAANEIEAFDWAYGAAGTPITAGEVPSSTPEPSTGALALLAAGAAGVAALRRRRKAAV